MMSEDYSKSKNKKSDKVENQKLMMKISSTNKNMSCGGIGCVILLGGALITAAAMGSAFLISRKHKKSTDKKDKIEDESSNKGLHSVLPHDHSSTTSCIEQLQPSSNGTAKLCLNDNESTSLSTTCFIQDEKPKLGMSDDKGEDTLNAIVSDHPKEEENSPSFDRLPEELVLSGTKISLLPQPDQELDEVSEARTEVIQGNERTEVLEHVHQDQAIIFSNPALQMDNRREFLEHNDKGESNELQHPGVIDTDTLEEGPTQEQEKQATGDEEINASNEHEPLNSAFGLMKAVDDDEDKCADAETQIDQVAKKRDLQIQINDEEECAKESDQANSCYEEATSENRPCSAYSIVPNLAASGIRNASIDDEHFAGSYEDEDKSHVQIKYSEEQCADAETKIDQINDEQVCSNKNDQENSCYEEAISENSHYGTYSMDAQDLAAPEIRNASMDDQNSAEVIQAIKETNTVDPAASGEQRPEADYPPIQLAEKQSFEQNCQGNISAEDNESSKSLSTDIEVAEKNVEVSSKEVKDEVEESVFVYEEEDDDYNNDDATEEVEDGISEGARNSSEQSPHSDKILPADSNQDLMLEHKEEKVKEEEKGTKTKENEACRVELKNTQNDFAITRCQQSSNGKDDSPVNVTDSYRNKLIYLNDIAAITRGRRVLLGALLVLIWYFCLNAFFLQYRRIQDTKSVSTKLYCTH